MLTRIFLVWRAPPVYGQIRTENERFLPVDRGVAFRAAISARKHGPQTCPQTCPYTRAVNMRVHMDRKHARKRSIQKSNDCEAA
jgi:hypothetical protein